MAVIQIAAFIILIAGLSYVWKEKIADVLPMAVCLLIIFLYGLAMVGGLGFFDGINLLVILGAVVFLLSRKKEDRLSMTGYCRKQLLHPGCILFFLTAVIITVCVWGKVVTWWDDYNFWATDVKSIFYLDGFAQKYGNAAPEFGDYPPGTQMIKWWFLHLQPEVFNEGLMFVGYYLMNIAFLMPLFRRLPGRNPLVLIAGALFLWIFPSVAESFYLRGTCADLTMAVIYGAFLSAVLDEEEHSRIFYYTRLVLYLMVLVLVKNVGFIWAAFAILFFFVYHLLIKRQEEKTLFARIKPVFWVAVLPVLTQLSWLAFCFQRRRVAKLTGTAVSMAGGNMGIPEVNDEMIRSFAEAFLTWPLHKWKTPAVDLTPIMLFLIICVAAYFITVKIKKSKKQALFLSLYFILSGIVFYSINLISHLTIFAVEEQYLQPFGMASSIERYGAPFMIGGMYVLLYLLLHGEDVPGRQMYKRYYMICFLLVFLCADHSLACEGLIGYKDAGQEVLQERKTIIGPEGEIFLYKLQESSQVRESLDQGNMRVLYVEDGTSVEWVRRTYLNFEASPVSMMYTAILPTQIDAREIMQAAEQAHAGYLYIEDMGKEAKAQLQMIFPEEDFSYETLYKLNGADGAYRLEPVQ